MVKEALKKGGGEGSYVTNLTSFKMRAILRIRAILTTRITRAFVLVGAAPIPFSTQSCENTSNTDARVCLAGYPSDEYVQVQNYPAENEF